ncbi:MAG TPA: amidohydrolase family protein [Stellaceae bacterium]|jgi:imidazolonepropionase-like amidohydrolase|nr:amidohydrolase family protein [Stellaceae bacterium]
MIVLKNARLIDGTGVAPVNGATVVVKNNRIDAVTTRNASDFPADAEIIDAAGMTVLPGLIDCHDHMANHKYDLAHRWRLDEPQSTRHLRTAAVLKQTLAAGYTTIRDAAGLDAGFKRAIEEGLIDGPRLVLSLAIISPYGGIGDAVSPVGLPLDDCCCIPGDPLLPPSVCNGIDEVRQVVRKMVRAGADVIKTATTGGASSRPGHGPRDAAFNLDEMQALVEEAQALDRRVMCHALGGRGLDIAIAAGVNSIEHGSYLDEDPRHLERMAERNIFFVPTLLVYEYHRKSPQPHVRERAEALVEHHVASIRRALEIGVKVVAGTDAGGHGHPANAGELECLVKSGMTPMQALQAATGWAAECLGQEAELGTIEAGKLADLVIVADDPLADISVLRDPARIALVVKDGKVAANRMSGRAPGQDRVSC